MVPIAGVRSVILNFLTSKRARYWLRSSILPGLAMLLTGCAPPFAANTSRITQLPEAVTRYYVTVTVTPGRDSLEISPGNDPAPRRAGGIRLGRNGLIVTAAHVARSIDETATVTDIDGDIRDAAIVHVIPSTDLALLKVNASTKLDPPPVNPLPKARLPVIGMGEPASSRTTDFRTGTVNTSKQPGAFRFGRFGFRDPIVLDMRIESGFSGGPVFDTGNRWIGMIVGYDPARSETGDFVPTTTTYVLPAEQILAYIDASGLPD